MKKNTVGNVYLLLLSGMTGKFMFSTCAIARIIRAVQEQRKMEAQKAREKEAMLQKRLNNLRPDATAFWQLLKAIGSQFPEYRWVHPQSIQEIEKRVSSVWDFGVRLIPASGTETEVKVAIAMFTGNRLIRLTEVCEEESETVEEIAVEINEMDPGDPEPEELVFTPAIAQTYAETHLKNMRMWLEEQCQATYVACCAVFVIPPDRLPEELFMWPLVCQKLTDGDLFDFVSANIISLEVGIEVQIPFVNCEQPVKVADASFIDNEPMFEENNNIAEEEFAGFKPEFVCCGANAPTPDDSCAPCEEED